VQQLGTCVSALTSIAQPVRRSNAKSFVVTNSINRGVVTQELGDENLYNWQFYIQESEAKEERKKKKKRSA
jgi:hypothetical protein